MRFKVPNRIREEFQWKCLHFECESWRFLTLQWSQGEPPDPPDSGWTPPLYAVLYATLYRLFMMLYVIAWLVVDVVINTDPFYWTFLTHWGQTFMVLYFVFSFFIVYLELANRITSEQRPKCDATLRWFHVITWIVFNIYVTIAFIITTSYWVGVTFDLISPAKSAASVNFHVHVINTVLASIELLVGNLKVRILHCYCPIVLGAIYLVFTLILHWAGVISSIYAVLDWMGGPGMAVGYALGILLIAVPLYHFVTTWGITELRQYLYKNRAKLKTHFFKTKHDKYVVSGRADVESSSVHVAKKPADSSNVVRNSTDESNNCVIEVKTNDVSTAKTESVNFNDASSVADDAL